jgi:arylsulfatase A-like enzyme
VPLVIVDPATPAPRREPRVVRDVDVAATIYDRTGTPAPADLDGRSLAPALRGEPLPPAFAYAETETWRGDAPPIRFPYAPDASDAPIALVARHRMVRDDRWKLVYAPARMGVTYMLFDSASDPDEAHDLAAANPAQVARLKAELWSWMLRDTTMIERGGYLLPRGEGR